MAINKVEYGGQVLIDLTADTVSADTLKKDYTAHAANGEVIVGTMEGGSKTPLYLIISTPPTKVEYTVNETLDLTGMVIKVLYSTGEQEVITDYTTDPVNGAVLSIENQSVTISYSDLTTSQPINVQIKVVPWATGTDKEIADMVAAADEGLIDLHDYWAVGDTRTINLSAISDYYFSLTAQTAELVLMDTVCKGFTVVDTGKAPSFMIGFKDCLSDKQYWSTNTSGYYWNVSGIRNWYNTSFINAFPTELQPIFKKFSWQLHPTSSSSTLITSEDYFANPHYLCQINSKYNSMIPSSEYDMYSLWEYQITETNRYKSTPYSNSNWQTCNTYTETMVICGTTKSTNYSGWSWYSESSYGTKYDKNYISPFGCI